MGKQYQTRDATASTPELTIPEQVSVALAEIAASAKEGLLALVVGAGLQVLGTLMEESVSAVAGPKGKHNPDRVAVRHGHEQGSVTLGGRRVAVQRPRVRAADGSGELPVAAYQLFSQPEVLGRLAVERLLGGLSTRRYPLGLEPVGSQAEQAASGDQQVGGVAPVCRHDPHRPGRTHERRPVPAGPGLLAGRRVHFAEHCCVVALGIDLDGTKHPLALVEGSTENATLATELLVGLRERGLDVTRPILVVIDGRQGAAPGRAGRVRPSGHRQMPGAQDPQPPRPAAPAAGRPGRAPHAHRLPRRLRPGRQAQLQALARELDKTHPGAAASLREGLAETLTVLRLGVPPTPARTLRSTTTIESMISICRDHAGNVKRWQDGQMALRSIAAGMGEAAKQFRRVNGYLHLPALRAALEAQVAGAVTGSCEDQEEVEAA